ncbi:hypothetical protein CY34DRAFT_810031 [Suillus luteus UH-Slu-Lm8-n1]|uniref:BCD1 alpha/beta domain-containing protein n=1 Tax=Suillus luteus UH-Slu-Lm8-n1 TaxID=930992 RepID=A0A0D0AI40_9AGAM|nr:hypothetical protein CY34DRAFT_810031 [Suillus luteus UH-Slu-Lm8-n1]
MNTYGWGAMMRDYCFLEEIGRKVSEWSGGIAREGYATDDRVKDTRGRGRARGTSGRGRGGRGTSGGGGSSKRDLLKAHLDNLDVDVLPVEMRRRKVNQSTLDAKAQVALLTIEFRFYPGAQSQSSSSATSVPTTLVHRNPINSSLIALLQRHVAQHAYFDKDHPRPKKEHHCPDRVTSLVHPHPDDPEGFRVPLCYLPAQMDLARIPYYPVQTGSSYHKLCPSQTIQDLLRGAHFAEFPTIHVHDPDSSTFVGNIVGKRGQPSPMSEQEQEHEHDVRAMKRTKLSTKARRMAISGPVGDYGIENEFGALGSYAESESGDQGSDVEARTTEDDVSGTDSLSANEGEGPALDCVAVLELIWASTLRS